MANSHAADGENPDTQNRKNEALNVILTDPQILDCYICCEPLCAPVFQCENGHISCSSCCIKVENKCPKCTLATGRIRCRAIEMVLESIEVPCRNTKYGCTRTTNFNQKIDHERSCVYEPCSCPSPGCFFVGSSEKLCSHFSEKHNSSAKSFIYNSRFTMCLNPGDNFRVLQAKNDGALFFLTQTVELCGNAVTVSRIGPSASAAKYCYELKAKTSGSYICLQSMAREFRTPVEIAPSKGSLLIPNGFFESPSQMILEFRIWPAH